jgi:hypothetical protein
MGRMARHARDCVTCRINAAVAIVSKYRRTQSMRMGKDCVLNVPMLARCVSVYMMTMIIGSLSVQTVLNGGIYGKHKKKHTGLLNGADQCPYVRQTTKKDD